jgi:hypothetical protein
LRSSSSKHFSHWISLHCRTFCDNLCVLNEWRTVSFETIHDGSLRPPHFYFRGRGCCSRPCDEGLSRRRPDGRRAFRNRYARPNMPGLFVSLVPAGGAVPRRPAACSGTLGRWNRRSGGEILGNPGMSRRAYRFRKVGVVFRRGPKGHPRLIGGQNDGHIESPKMSDEPGAAPVLPIDIILPQLELFWSPGNLCKLL